MDRFQQTYDQYKNQTDQTDDLKQQGTNNQSNKDEIIAVRKNDEGDLIAFQTQSGRQLDYLEALSEAKNGHLAHVDVFHKYGRDILRSEPDGITENNLDSLPEF